jgi:hypothetical protein
MGWKWGKQNNVALYANPERKRASRINGQSLRDHDRVKRPAAKKAKKKSSTTWCRVYALREAEGKPIRYIGQTRLGLHERLRWHFKGIKERQENGLALSKAQKWIARLPTPPVIELIDGKEIWDISEAVWIDRLRTRGEPLLNVKSVVA